MARNRQRPNRDYVFRLCALRLFGFACNSFFVSCLWWLVMCFVLVWLWHLLGVWIMCLVFVLGYFHLFTARCFLSWYNSTGPLVHPTSGFQTSLAHVHDASHVANIKLSAPQWNCSQSAARLRNRSIQHMVSSENQISLQG